MKFRMNKKIAEGKSCPLIFLLPNFTVFILVYHHEIDIHFIDTFVVSNVLIVVHVLW